MRRAARRRPDVRYPICPKSYLPLQADHLARRDARAGRIGAAQGEGRLQRPSAAERLAGALPQLHHDGLGLAGAHAEALRAVLLLAADQPQLAAGDRAVVAFAADPHLHAALAIDPQALAGLYLGERPALLRLPAGLNRAAAGRVVVAAGGASGGRRAGVDPEVLERAAGELRPRGRVDPLEPEAGVDGVVGGDHAALGELLAALRPAVRRVVRALGRRTDLPRRVQRLLEVVELERRRAVGQAPVVDPGAEAQRPPVGDDRDPQVHLLAGVRRQVDRPVRPSAGLAGQRVPVPGRPGRVARGGPVVQEERVRRVGVRRQTLRTALAGLLRGEALVGVTGAVRVDLGQRRPVVAVRIGGDVARLHGDPVPVELHVPGELEVQLRRGGTGEV